MLPAVPGTRPGWRKTDEVQTRHLVKVQKLVIGGHLRVVRRLGQQAGDSGRDSNSAEILQHADPLVALHHIEVVEVLHHLDRVPDALLQVDAAQGAPLGGELGVRREDRVEPSGESVPPKVVAGAVDLLHGDLRQTQGFPAAPPASPGHPAGCGGPSPPPGPGRL